MVVRTTSLPELCSRETPETPKGNCAFFMLANPTQFGGADHFAREVEQLAIFFPRVGRLAGFAGLAGGMVAVFTVHLTIHVEFLWYNVIGCVGVLVVGLAFAPFSRRR